MIASRVRLSDHTRVSDVHSSPFRQGKSLKRILSEVTRGQVHIYGSGVLRTGEMRSKPQKHPRVSLIGSRGVLVIGRSFRKMER